MRTIHHYYIESLIDKDVADNKTAETVTLKDCSPPSAIPMSDNLNREDARIKTFINWPHSYINTKKLAQTGFYYIGPSDNVKCYFCKVEIGRWEPEDNEVAEHVRWSQNCPLLKRRETNNVPINESELNEILPAPTYDVCGPCGVVDVRHGSYAESSFSVPPIETQTLRPPDHPEYAIESARLRSFDDWPKTMKQTPKDLSDAGFFYTQTGDRVICFSCGGGLRDWDENDIPWEQHAQWFSKCEYLKLIKGQDYIDSVITNKKVQEIDESICKDTALVKDTSASASVSKSTATEQQNDDTLQEKKLCESKLCKICYSCEYNTAFFPCGHVVACAKCASSVTKCPMCRKRFERVIRVYFS